MTDAKGFTAMQDEGQGAPIAEGARREDGKRDSDVKPSSGNSFGKSPAFQMNSGSMRKSPESDARRPSLVRNSDLGLLRQKSTIPVNTVNPFVGTWQKTEGVYNKTKTVLFFPIALLRLFFCVLIVLMCAGWCKLCLIGVKSPDDIGPLRRFVFINPGVRVFCRMFLFVVGFYWIPVKGRRDPSARVMIGNHTTMLDVVVLLYVVAPSFLSKATVLQVPLIGTICQALQVIGVDRASHTDKEKTKIKMREHVSRELAPPLLVFPEGTTSRYDTLLRFKPGAFEFGLAVQPVLLHWRWNFTDPSSCATTSLKSWALQILTQAYHYVELEYLPVLSPQPEEASNPLFFAANARKVVFKGLQRRAAKRTCTPGFVHEMHEVQQGVDDFLVWKRLMAARIKELHLALQTFSLESVRDAIELASPVLTSRKRIDLSYVLAACERYLRIWHSSTIPGHEHKSLLCYEDLTRCAIGDSAGTKARAVFVGAFLEAAVFSCTSADAVDFRQFATALIWLSNCSSVWGVPFSVFEEAPLDPGVVKWASVRARIAFSVLCAVQIMKDDVTREDFVALVGEGKCASTWDIVFEPPQEEESECGSSSSFGRPHYKVDLFKDTIVHALTAPTTNESTKESVKKRAAYDLVESCFELIDKRFHTAYYEGGAFFLTEAETSKIHDKVLPMAREGSVEEQVVEDPSDVMGDAKVDPSEQV